MSSKIEQLIEEIDDYIGSCKYQALSGKKIVVNKDDIDELIQELREVTPDEIKRYQKIISNKEAIFEDARVKAQKLIDEATQYTNQLISENEIMKQAYARADEVVNEARLTAQKMLDNAVIETNEMRTSIEAYTDSKLAEMEAILVNFSKEYVANNDVLMESMNYYTDLIQSNRRELLPTVELEEVLSTEEN